MTPPPHRDRRLWFAVAAVFALLALPPARAWLEATMTRHMLVQMPLLVGLGFAVGHRLPARLRNRLLARAGGPLACLTAASFAATYWMLPRALDAAAAGGAAEAAKFLTLPLLIGLPTGLAWRALGVIGRGFVWTNLISMLLFAGWLYIAAPVRVCNNYLLDDQAQAGWWMIRIAALIFAAWFVALFTGRRRGMMAVRGRHPGTPPRRAGLLPAAMPPFRTQ